MFHYPCLLNLNHSNNEAKLLLNFITGPVYPSKYPHPTKTATANLHPPIPIHPSRMTTNAQKF